MHICHIPTQNIYACKNFHHSVYTYVSSAVRVILINVFPSLQSYFGGERRCQDGVEEVDPNDLICPLCSDTSKDKVRNIAFHDWLIDFSIMPYWQHFSHFIILVLTNITLSCQKKNHSTSELWKKTVVFSWKKKYIYMYKYQIYM